MATSTPRRRTGRGSLFHAVLRGARQMSARLRAWLVVADPGLEGVRRAARTFLIAVGSVLTTLALVSLVAPHAGLIAPLLAGMVGLQVGLGINDPTAHGKAVTLVCFVLTMAGAVAIGALVATSAILVDACLLVVLFLAFALRRFGQRFQPLGLAAFIGFYLASLLHVSLAALPSLFLGIGVGAAWGIALVLLFLPDHPTKTRERLIATFFADAVAVLADLRHSLTPMGAPSAAESRPLPPGRALARLTDTEVRLASTFADEDSQVGANGGHGQHEQFEREAIEYFIADTLISLETLTDATASLTARGLLVDPLRERLDRLYATLARAFAEHAVRGHFQMFAPVLDALLDFSTFSALPDPKLARRFVYQIALAVRWLATDPTPSDLADRDERAERDEYPAPPLPSADGRPGTASHDGTGTPSDQRTTRARNAVLDPTTKQAVQAVIAGAISIVIGALLSPTHQYWVVLTAFVVLSRTGSVGTTYLRAVQRVVGTVGGAVLGFGLAWLVAGAPLAVLILLFLGVFCAVVLFSISYGAMVGCITVMLALLYDLLLGQVQAAILVARVLDTLAGALIGVVIAVVLFPRRTTDDARANTAQYFGALSDYLTHVLPALLAGAPAPEPLADTRALTETRQTARESLLTLRRLPGARGRRGADTLLRGVMQTGYYARRLTDPMARHLGASVSLPETAADTPGEAVVRSVMESTCANLDVLCRTLGGARGVPTQPLPPHEVLQLRHFETFAAREMPTHDSTPIPVAETLATAPEPQAHVSERVLRDALLARTAHYLWHIDQAVERLAIDLGARQAPEEVTTGATATPPSESSGTERASRWQPGPAPTSAPTSASS